MRLLPVSLLLSLLASAALAEAPEKPLGAMDVPGEIAPASEDSTDEPSVSTTIFNGVEVPVLTEIEGEKLSSMVKKGYWFVKYYS